MHGRPMTPLIPQPSAYSLCLLSLLAMGCFGVPELPANATSPDASSDADAGDDAAADQGQQPDEGVEPDMADPPDMSGPDATGDAPSDMSGGVAGLRVLVVVGNSADDLQFRAVRDELIFSDAIVTTADDDDQPPAVGDVDVILFSSTAEGSRAQSFTDLAIPIVVMRALALDDFRMASVGSATMADIETRFSASGTAHPIVEGLPESFDIVDAPQDFACLNQLPNGSSDVGALEDGSCATNMWTFESGDNLLNQRPAPERRVGALLGLGDASDLNLNASGWSLLRRSIEWAAHRR